MQQTTTSDAAADTLVLAIALVLLLSLALAIAVIVFRTCRQPHLIEVGGTAHDV
jgi:hypothetical protein